MLPGCCFVSFHFLYYILCSCSVHGWFSLALQAGCTAPLTYCTYFRLLRVTIMLPKWFVYVANCLPLPPLRKHSNSGTQRKVANCKSRSYGAAAAAAAGILRATIRGRRRRRRCRDSHEADRRQGLQSTFEDLTGTNTYDVRKFFGFFDPLPPLSLSQIG